MHKYTEKSHLKNHYENGRQEPWVLLESFTEDGKFIEYTSNYISAAISEYDGYIPDAENIKILVWHSSESIEDPTNYLPIEISEVETITRTKDDQVALEDEVRKWSKDDISSSNYSTKRAEFILNNIDRITPYCTCLLTCTCGERTVFKSVSEAFANQELEHKNSDHNSLIWYYCGNINEEIRSSAHSVYEGSKSNYTGILDRIRNKRINKDPIHIVPIHYTPLSVALQEIDAYKVTEHSTEQPPQPPK
jgi:hypothetical protein